MAENFWDKVKEKAYLKHEYNESHNLLDDNIKNWDEAFVEEAINEKIAEEAYYNYLHGYNDPIQNWIHAKKDIHDRISFLAYYLHESNINKSPEENWCTAEKIYAENF